MRIIVYSIPQPHLSIAMLPPALETFLAASRCAAPSLHCRAPLSPPSKDGRVFQWCATTPWHDAIASCQKSFPVKYGAPTCRVNDSANGKRPPPQKPPRSQRRIIGAKALAACGLLGSSSAVFEPEQVMSSRLHKRQLSEAFQTWGKCPHHFSGNQSRHCHVKDAVTRKSSRQSQKLPRVFWYAAYTSAGHY